MSKRNEYPSNKSVTARIEAAGSAIAYVDGILSMVVELGSDMNPRLLDRIKEARQRLEVATSALIGE